jgi:hypothetical protein
MSSGSTDTARGSGSTKIGLALVVVATPAGTGEGVRVHAVASSNIAKAGRNGFIP